MGQKLIFGIEIKGAKNNQRNVLNKQTNRNSCASVGQNDLFLVLPQIKRFLNLKQLFVGFFHLQLQPFLQLHIKTSVVFGVGSFFLWILNFCSRLCLSCIPLDFDLSFRQRLHISLVVIFWEACVLAIQILPFSLNLIVFHQTRADPRQNFSKDVIFAIWEVLDIHNDSFFILADSYQLQLNYYKDLFIGLVKKSVLYSLVVFLPQQSVVISYRNLSLYLTLQSHLFNIETQMAEEQGGAPYQFTNSEGKTGNSSRDYTGEGHAVYPNADQYFGDYVNGQRTGKGKYIYANGDRYEGAFLSNKKHGIGRFTTKDKGQYYGQWENGIKHGQGTYVYANKDSYSGWWMFGKKHGHGTYTYSQTGAKLVGEWAENQIVKGKWLFTNGTYYEGSFSNNKPNGDGIWHFSNGNVVAGQYKQTVIPNEDPDDKKVNIKLEYQSNVGISESAWQINAHEIF